MGDLLLTRNSNRVGDLHFHYNLRSMHSLLRQLGRHRTRRTMYQQGELFHLEQYPQHCDRYSDPSPSSPHRLESSDEHPPQDRSNSYLRRGKPVRALLPSFTLISRIQPQN